MKVTVNHKDGVMEYPCLKINDDNNVVLFTAHNEGILLFSSGGKPPAYWSSSYWCEAVFEPFHGSVILEN